MRERAKQASAQNHHVFSFLRTIISNTHSPVILWFDRDKIATEMIFAANLSEKPSKQHIQNRPKSDTGKYDYLHK